ncbi:MAG: serine/threonine protein kinase [Myxococcales bacterium]|nr:serine/threonine protein kinase [Myxococcales bacterium]
MTDPSAEARVPLGVGDRVGKYVLERELGRGGMGAVFAARHDVLGELVAIKVLYAGHAKDPEIVRRFVNEARAAAKIKSEHVARMIDTGDVNGAPYIVLELLEGTDLATLVERGGPLTVGRAADYVLQALDALGQAHALGIVHRDIKPSNVFLAKRPSGAEQIKLLDFGIAKFSEESSGSGSSTSTAAAFGSPDYMSPEQIKSSKNVDARADLWSIGVVLFELLTGDRPFLGETPGATFAAILTEPPRSLRSLRPDIPKDFEAIVERCLRRDLDARMPDVATLAAALRPFAIDSGPASGPISNAGSSPRGLGHEATLAASSSSSSSSSSSGRAHTASPTTVPSRGVDVAKPRGPAVLVAAFAVATLVTGGTLMARRTTTGVAAPSPSAPSSLPPVESATPPSTPSQVIAPPSATEVQAAPSAPASTASLVGRAPSRTRPQSTASSAASPSAKSPPLAAAPSGPIAPPSASAPAFDRMR